MNLFLFSCFRRQKIIAVSDHLHRGMSADYSLSFSILPFEIIIKWNSTQHEPHSNN